MSIDNVSMTIATTIFYNSNKLSDITYPTLVFFFTGDGLLLSV
jgi:hypothetical protein